MKRLKNNETIEVLGASFNGVKDMIEHARKRMPKDGVYVGEDSQLYPCFDSEDYMSEKSITTIDKHKGISERLNTTRSGRTTIV